MQLARKLRKNRYLVVVDIIITPIRHMHPIMDLRILSLSEGSKICVSVRHLRSSILNIPNMVGSSSTIFRIGRVWRHISLQGHVIPVHSRVRACNQIAVKLIEERNAFCGLIFWMLNALGRGDMFC